MGVIIKNYSLSRNGVNPISDYLSYRSISHVISQSNPDIVIAYTAKCSDRRVRVPRLHSSALLPVLMAAVNE